MPQKEYTLGVEINLVNPEIVFFTGKNKNRDRETLTISNIQKGVNGYAMKSLSKEELKEITRFLINLILE